MDSSNESGAAGTIMCPSAERDNRCVEGCPYDGLMSRELGGGLHRAAGSLLLLGAIHATSALSASQVSSPARAASA